MDVAGDLAGGGALFLDGGGDGDGEAVDRADGGADLLDRLDRVTGGGLPS
jgi:hypothetical protein